LQDKTGITNKRIKMKKFYFAFALLLCFDLVFAGNETAGFSRDDGLEVVRDDIYKLMWQDGKDVFEGDWKEAKRYCENLKFAGYSDWRLPTRKELLSITDDSKSDWQRVSDPKKCSKAAYDGACRLAINSAFKNVKLYYYYQSSTKNVDSSYGVRIVYFGDGSDTWSGLSKRHRVRCVRQY
jgi:hypothetical protein